MFPRPSRLFRLIIVLSIIIFLAVSMYIITFDVHATNVINDHKFRNKFSYTGLFNYTSRLQLNSYPGDKQDISKTQERLYTPALENEQSFQEIIIQQLNQNRIIHVSHDSGQRIINKPNVQEVNPHNFSYIHNPSNICHRPTAFLVYIHSSPENLKKRQAVRQTWGHPKLLSLYNATLMFVLGRVLNPVIQSLIDMEVAEYGDILQETFIDSYRNLTYKGMSGLKWANYFCAKTAFLLKTDDDILIDIVSFMENLYTKIIPSRGVHTNLVLCNVWNRMKVIRDPKSKWYVSKEEFSEEYFPSYCSGSAFLLSGDLIPAMYETSLQTPFFWVDDFYITGMLVNKLKIQHTRFNSAYLLNYNIAEEKLKNDSREYIILHVKKLNLFLKLWSLLMQRHKGMDKYLVTLSMFSLSGRDKRHPDVNVSDITTYTTTQSERSDEESPVSMNYIFNSL